jgi:hypothetical protein
VLAAYADQATDYERRTALYHGWRELLVDQLPVHRGDVVLDVGCGTGLCFELLTTPVQDAVIAEPADAALFSAVHDVLQCPAALHTVLAALRPGAWVGAAGGKWPAPWLAALSALVAAVHAPFVRDFTGFDRPWRYLAELVDDLRVTEIAFGTGYLAWVAPPTARHPCLGCCVRR